MKRVCVIIDDISDISECAEVNFRNISQPTATLEKAVEYLDLQRKSTSTITVS